MSGVLLSSVTKKYGDVTALHALDLEIREGEFLTLLGPSGCGKTTTLRLVAGFIQPTSGTIFLGDDDITAVAPQHRRIGMVFQDYALFPHLNVFENVAFGLRLRRTPAARLRERVSEVLALVGLEHLRDRDVTTLSGGERQRVALARALAPEPRLLMLDEPLAALDRNLRDRLAEDLGAILEELDLPAIYVTHDVEEALTVADRVAVMQPRRIARIGTPQEIYREPGSEYVARFLGLDNLIAARLVQAGGRPVLRTELGDLPAEALTPPDDDDADLKVLLRPTGISIHEDAPERPVSSPDRWVLHGELTGRSFRGAAQRIQLTVAGIELRFRVAADQPLPQTGAPVTFAISPRRGACLIRE
jgi:ABC-type Fe3+/spermidine/putrescine transport system ATPase subunit